MVDDPIVQMRRRLGRHMVLAPIGVVGCMALGFGLAAAAKRALSPDAKAEGAAMALVVLLSLAGFFGGLAAGAWSTYKNLRCPACDAWIAMYISWKFSAFGGAVGDACPRCGVTLFAPGVTRRFIYVLVAIALTAMLVGGIGAFGAMRTRARPHASSSQP